jgi:hypothetical protein
VQLAAAFMAGRAAAFPAGWLPNNPSGIAVLAVKVYQLFIDDSAVQRTDAEMALAIMQVSREFDAATAI